MPTCTPLVPDRAVVWLRFLASVIEMKRRKGADVMRKSMCIKQEKEKMRTRGEPAMPAETNQITPTAVRDGEHLKITRSLDTVDLWACLRTSESENLQSFFANATQCRR